MFTGAVVEPLLGGYLADTLGFRPIFGVIAAGRLAGILVFVWLTVRRPRPVGASPPAG